MYAQTTPSGHTTDVLRETLQGIHTLEDYLLDEAMTRHLPDETPERRAELADALLVCNRLMHEVAGRLDMTSYAAPRELAENTARTVRDGTFDWAAVDTDAPSLALAA